MSLPPPRCLTQLPMRLSTQGWVSLSYFYEQNVQRNIMRSIVKPFSQHRGNVIDKPTPNIRAIRAYNSSGESGHLKASNKDQDTTKEEKPNTAAYETTEAAS